MKLNISFRFIFLIYKCLNVGFPILLNFIQFIGLYIITIIIDFDAKPILCANRRSLFQMATGSF